MLSRFDNIVFDLGGVVFEIDRESCVERLDSLGLPGAASLLDLYCQKGDFLALEEGRLTLAEFYDILRSKCINRAVTDKDFEETLNSFITHLPVGRLQAIRKLREMGKRTYVLSNTNPLMYNSVIAQLFRQESLTINDYFDGIVLSFQEQVCKPDPEIFHRLINRYHLDGKRTLFIDDSAHNVEAARACGIEAYHLPENAEFIDVLKLR